MRSDKVQQMEGSRDENENGIQTFASNRVLFLAISKIFFFLVQLFSNDPGNPLKSPWKWALTQPLPFITSGSKTKISIVIVDWGKKSRVQPPMYIMQDNLPS